MAVVRKTRPVGEPVDFLPVLSRGKHKRPSRGACFMEYTALLAGERFSDAPRCVDPELAAVLRHANDTLSDADRPRLVPLLGRAIGLAADPPEPAPGRQPGDEPGEDDVARYARTTATLHRAVSARFMAALGHEPTPDELVLHDGGRDVDALFWYLMREPSKLRTSREYVDRLIARLELLHDCFDAALTELGLPRLPVAREPAVPWPAGLPVSAPPAAAPPR